MTGEGSTALRVFISYSRRDRAIAERLREELSSGGFEAFLDLHDIVKGEPWQDRLRALIERADAVLFLISPDSVRSEICEWEVNEAERVGKRIFPAVVRATEDDAIPQRLKRLNFTFLDSDRQRESELALLSNELSADASWVREHSRLAELALRWERAGHPSRLLLHGDDIAAGERWRDERPPGAPELTALHAHFLRASRAGAVRRQRRWIAGSLLVAAFAVALSAFALIQRNAAVENETIAERRAAHLATDAALARAENGALDDSLLMLLDASTRFEPSEVPDKLLLTLRDVTRTAKARRSFWFSAGSRAFYLDDRVVVFDPEQQIVFSIAPDERVPTALGPYSATPVAAAASERALYYLSADAELFELPLSEGPLTGARSLAPIGQGSETMSWHPASLSVNASGRVIGDRVFRRGDGESVERELWRHDPASGHTTRVTVPGANGRYLGADERAGYFVGKGNALLRVGLDDGRAATLRSKAAAELQIAPCERIRGRPSRQQIARIYATLSLELQSVECAGAFGDIALMRYERYLARGILDLYFLLPHDVAPDEAPTRHGLDAVLERLGSQGNSQPFDWYTGSGEASMLAVSYADSILVLVPRSDDRRNLEVRADGDGVVAEIATGDATDGGAFYGDTLLAYSGPDGTRYRVVVIDLARDDDTTSAVADGTSPERAYWGSCSVQRPKQGGTKGVRERMFSYRSGDEGSTVIRAGDSELTLPLAQIECATASDRRRALAVADDTGVIVYDIATLEDGPETPSEIARIDDQSVRTVSFFGEEHEDLITTHAYKIVRWRRGADGTHTPETIYRSADRVLFAEGDPSGKRLLVWESLDHAAARVRLVSLPYEGRDWLLGPPMWLVDNPDVFIGRDGAIYRAEGGSYRMMPAVDLERLRHGAESALSHGCTPVTDGDYRSSSCWP